MDKKREHSCLNAVFGRMNLRVSEAEEPDFVCSVASGFSFGVEVTEFYRTESDARLARIDGYATDLISGGNHRHKDDRQQIPVKDVIYRRNETGEEIPLKAISREIPSHRVTVQSLLERIAAKNGKYVRYANRIAPVDLIVDDVDQILRFESIRQLLSPMLDKDELRLSPFREIYLLTYSAAKGPVMVPLRANLFASEIALFSMVYSDYRKSHDGPDTVGAFLTSLAVNLVERLPDMRYDVDNGIPRYIFASVAWILNEQQNVEIRDISDQFLRDAKQLSPDVDGNEMTDELRTLLVESRKRKFAAYELILPVQTTSDGAPS
jgi:hypothetical protein